MYAVYQNIIREFILKKFSAKRIVNENILKLDYMDGQAGMTIEFRNKEKVISCIQFFAVLFGVSTGSNLEKKVDDLGNGVIIKCGMFTYRLNNWEIIFRNDSDCKMFGVSLFLLEPLKFVQKNMSVIELLDDINVKRFLLGIKEYIEGLDVVHIKCLLIMEVDLVGDINIEIARRYINLLIDRPKMRELWDGIN